MIELRIQHIALLLGLLPLGDVDAHANDPLGARTPSYTIEQRLSVQRTTNNPVLHAEITPLVGYGLVVNPCHSIKILSVHSGSPFTKRYFCGALSLTLAKILTSSAEAHHAEHRIVL